MKKTAVVLALAALSVPLAAQAVDEELRAQCQQYAVEDKVPPEDLEQFMKECMGETEQEPAAQPKGKTAE
jgi:hypothetical protein